MARWNDSDRQPLALLRARTKLSAENVAHILGITYQTLYRYEHGLSDISLTIAEKMAILYGVSFDDIRMAVKNTPKKEKNKK